MPTALFSDCQMRKPNISDLASSFLKNIPSQFPPSNSPYVVGGMLLHLLKWKKGDTFLEIAKEYRKLVC